MKGIFTLLFVFVGMAVYGQAIPKWSVINHYGSLRVDRPVSVKVDGRGNSYTLMSYEDDITIGTTTFPEPEYDQDFAIVKHDKDGKLLYATRVAQKRDFVNTVLPKVKAITVDEDENVYLCAEFSDTIVVGGLKIGLHPNSYGDLFVAKIDKNGNAQWLRSLGASTRETLSDIAVDKTGNIYLSGSFYGYVTDIGTFHLVSITGENNMILCKLNNSGVLQWVKYTTAGDATAQQMVINSNNDIVLAGRCRNAFSFDGTNYYNTNNASYLFTCKFSTAGNLQWVNTPFSTGYIELYSMAADHKGDVLMIGRHRAVPLKFTPTDTLVNNSFFQYFFASYSSAGALNWAKGFASTSDITESLGVTCDLDNNWYIGGYLYGYWVYNNTDTIAKTEKFEHSSVTKLNNSGVKQWTLTAGPNTRPRDIACDNANNLYLVGQYGCYNCTVPFGDSLLPPSPGSQDADVYIAKISAQELVKTLSPGKSVYCVADTLAVPFTYVDTVFKPGSMFELEISDASGKFGTSGRVITMISFKMPDTFAVPFNSYPPGTGYRVRMKSSNPAFYGWDNGFDITLNATPLKPFITTVDDELLANPPTGPLEWFKDGNSLGLNSSPFKPQSAGMYTVKTSNSSGCSSISDPFWFAPAGVNSLDISDVDIYPNPVTDGKFYISSGVDIATIDILAMDGKLIYHVQPDTRSISHHLEVSVPQDLPVGIYMLKCYNANGNTIIRKLTLK